MTETSNLHIAVVGGGPGGYAAAFLAADLGLKVTLIDPEANPGGVCLYRGCIPSKALLHVAKLIDESRHAKNWGIEYADPKIDLARLRSWKEGVVKKLTGGLGILSKQRKVEYIQGRAAFENSNTLRISKAGGGDESLTFDRIILATGSRPAIIPSLKLDTPRMHGLHLRARSERAAGHSARDRWRLYRARAGHGVCRPGLESFGGRDAVRAASGRRPRSGSSSAQAPRKKFRLYSSEHYGRSRERRIQRHPRDLRWTRRQGERESLRQSSGLSRTQAEFRNCRIGQDSGPGGTRADSSR